MEKDIEKIVNEKFPEYLNILNQWMQKETVIPHSEKNRVIRAVLFLAGNDSSKISELLRLAELDYRDLLWQASRI